MDLKYVGRGFVDTNKVRSFPDRSAAIMLATGLWAELNDDDKAEVATYLKNEAKLVKVREKCIHCRDKKVLASAQQAPTVPYTNHILETPQAPTDSQQSEQTASQSPDVEGQVNQTGSAEVNEIATEKDPNLTQEQRLTKEQEAQGGSPLEAEVTQENVPIETMDVPTKS